MIKFWRTSDNSDESQVKFVRLEEYLPLRRNEIILILQKTKKIDQPFSIGIVQPILKCIIESLVLELIKPGHGVLMWQNNGEDNSWNNTCVRFTVWQPMLQINESH